jgi:penicillin-binding protein 1A
MRAAHEKRPVTDFPRPTNVVVVKIDPATGLLARPDQEDAIEEEFLDGTAPNEVASLDGGVEAGAIDGDGGLAFDPEAVQAGSIPAGAQAAAPRRPTPGRRRR